jgi:hypothetical protein
MTGSEVAKTIVDTACQPHVRLGLGMLESVYHDAAEPQPNVGQDSILSRTGWKPVLQNARKKTRNHEVVE